MNEFPWLKKKPLKLVRLLLSSYHYAYGEHLLGNKVIGTSNLQFGHLLFNMSNPVMAHDAKDDPCLNYVNAKALELWHRSWNEMIGMPSKLTAPKKERQKRQNDLNKVNTENPIQNYQGIRINSKGELFCISNARIWTIFNEKGHPCGQAATFTNWWSI